MFVLLSGEGPTDIGVSNGELGPMAKLIFKFAEDYLNYSLGDTDQFNIIHKADLAEEAKNLKQISLRGKKTQVETRYFYNNARALAEIAKKAYANHPNLLLILFRDADGTHNDGRGMWQDKWNSMLYGFKIAEVNTGIPMLPMPKSEAWLLCALREQGQNCEKLERESGNDDSPNSLKLQLREHLGEAATRELLNQKVDDGEIDIGQIDMPSFNKFKARFAEVLQRYGLRNLRT